MSGLAYPIMETDPDGLETATGKPFADLTLDNILSGKLAAADFTITAKALRMQAQVARQVSRDTLADNFERAAELVQVPDAVVMEIYELLRPGRAASAAVLKACAQNLRDAYGARTMAAFIDQAADAYERRSLFRQRY